MTDTKTPDVIIRGKAIKFHNFDPELGEIFGFNHIELDLNRKGKLSSWQSKHHLQKRNYIMIILVGLALILICYLFGVVTRFHTDVSQAPPSAHIVFGVIPIWMLITAIIIWRNRTAEIQDELVAIVTGQLELYGDGLNRNSRMFKVGHLQWNLDIEQIKDLSKFYHQHDKLPYVAVYYLANSDQLLSVVQVDMLADHGNDSSDMYVAGDELTIGFFDKLRRL